MDCVTWHVFQKSGSGGRGRGPRGLGHQNEHKPLSFRNAIPAQRLYIKRELGVRGRYPSHIYICRVNHVSVGPFCPAAKTSVIRLQTYRESCQRGPAFPFPRLIVDTCSKDRGRITSASRSSPVNGPTGVYVASGGWYRQS